MEEYKDMGSDALVAYDASDATDAISATMGSRNRK